MTLLVGYASEHGSTVGVAQRIAARLRDRGCTVDLRSLDAAPGADSYEAAVLGSAVHSGSWLTEASGYVRANTDALGRIPVWLFSVGLARAVGGWFEKHARDPEEIMELCRGFDLREHRMLAGALQPHHLPLPARVFYRLIGGRYGDFRDWEEIDAWADTIAAGLSASGTPGTASV